MSLKTSSAIDFLNHDDGHPTDQIGQDLRGGFDSDQSLRDQNSMRDERDSSTLRKTSLTLSEEIHNHNEYVASDAEPLKDITPSEDKVTLYLVKKQSSMDTETLLVHRQQNDSIKSAKQQQVQSNGQNLVYKGEADSFSEHRNIFLNAVYSHIYSPDLELAIKTLQEDDKKGDLLISVITGNYEEKVPLWKYREVIVDSYRYSRQQPDQKSVKKFLKKSVKKPHRVDVQQKKVLSSFNKYVYQSYKKQLGLKVTTMKEMKELLEIGDDQKLEDVFKRMCGGDTKNRLKNEVIKFVLEKNVFSEHLCVESFAEILEKMDQETEKDIGTNIVNKFNELTCDQLEKYYFEENKDQKKVRRRNSKSPFVKTENIDAILKLFYKLIRVSGSHKLNAEKIITLKDDFIDHKKKRLNDIRSGLTENGLLVD